MRCSRIDVISTRYPASERVAFYFLISSGNAKLNMVTSVLSTVVWGATMVIFIQNKSLYEPEFWNLNVGLQCVFVVLFAHKALLHRMSKSCCCSAAAATAAEAGTSDDNGHNDSAIKINSASANDSASPVKKRSQSAVRPAASTAATTRSPSPAPRRRATRSQKKVLSDK